MNRVILIRHLIGLLMLNGIWFLFTPCNLIPTAKLDFASILVSFLLQHLEIAIFNTRRCRIQSRIYLVVVSFFRYHQIFSDFKLTMESLRLVGCGLVGKITSWTWILFLLSEVYWRILSFTLCQSLELRLCVWDRKLITKRRDLLCWAIVVP